MARQGHLYSFAEQRVIALESGEVADVAVIIESVGWLGQHFRVPAAFLTPLPMRYFHQVEDS